MIESHLQSPLWSGFSDEPHVACTAQADTRVVSSRAEANLPRESWSTWILLEETRKGQVGGLLSSSSSIAFLGPCFSVSHHSRAEPDHEDAEVGTGWALHHCRGLCLQPWPLGLLHAHPIPPIPSSAELFLRLSDVIGPFSGSSRQAEAAAQLSVFQGHCLCRSWMGSVAVLHLSAPYQCSTEESEPMEQGLRSEAKLMRSQLDQRGALPCKGHRKDDSTCDVNWTEALSWQRVDLFLSLGRICFYCHRLKALAQEIGPFDDGISRKVSGMNIFP